MEWFEDLYNRQIYFDLYAEEDTRLAKSEVESILHLLHLQAGHTILDAGCGYGRHAVELAKRGFRVTGIDLAAKQIEAAVRNASDAGVEVNFILGDLREMQFQDEFDLVLNLFLTFGFFEEEAENQKMLERMVSALRPGGVLLMDLWNREKMIRDFSAIQVEERPGRIKIEKHWQFDAWNGRLNWENEVTFPDGRKEKWTHSVRAYTLVELRKMLERAGMQLMDVYGDFQGNDYTLESPQMILVARKSEGNPAQRT